MNKPFTMEMDREPQDRSDDQFGERSKETPKPDDKQNVSQDESGLDFDEDLQVKREPTPGTLMMRNFLNKFKHR